MHRINFRWRTTLECYVFPEHFQKLVNQLRAWQLKVAEKENALAMQTISYEMGNRKFEIKESMALQELLMVPCTHRKVEQSVPHESEGEGPGHGIPEEK